MTTTPPASSLESPVATAGGLADWLRLLRPRQWVKNGFVAAPLLFAGKAADLPMAVDVLLTLAGFCLAASGVYLLNDLVDSREDRAHPVKRHRPLAAGRVTRSHAVVVAGLLAASGLGLALAAAPLAGAWVAGYLGLNLAYTFWLKHVVLLDVFAIAAFFLLRLLAGAAAAEVQPSIWLLLCGGLLALYLGFAKRRHELVLLGDSSSDHRSVLGHYSPALLDQISAVLLAVTIVAYLMYTLTSETAARVGSDALSYGVPFVLYGLFRYLFLVHRHSLGSPTETVFADRPLMVTVLLWVAYSAWVMYRP